jgi:serine/threonine protein kinase/CRP-like cAMP-binding protein
METVAGRGTTVCKGMGFKTLLDKWKGQDVSVDGESVSADKNKITAKAKAKAKAAPKSSPIPRVSEQEKVLAKQQARRQSLNMNVYQHPMNWETDFAPPKFRHSSDEKKLIRKALKKNFVFSDLTDRDLKPLVAAFETCTFEKDQVIILQGNPGDFFYILASGKVSFFVNEIQVGKTDNVGASFGELALLYTCPRAASVFATEETQLFRVDQTTFRFVLKSQTIKSGEEKREILQGVSFLKDLTQADLNKLSNAMTPVLFEKDQVLVRKGDEGDAFYLIQEGQVLVKDISVGPTSYEDQTLGPGEYFGERALATSEPRAANIVGLTEGIAFSIDRITFEKVLGNMSRIILRAQDTRKLLGIKVIADANLDAQQMSNLAQLVSDRNFSLGQLIMQEGNETKAALFLVREGKVQIKSDTVDHVVERGGYFGHEMLAGGNEERVKAPYTVRAAVDCVCGVLTLVECQSVFEVEGNCDISSELNCEVEAQHDDIPTEQYVPKTSAKLEDLERHTILGEGSFGQVWLVSESLPDNSRRPYALKIQAKSYLAEEGQIASVVEEKNTMMKMHHPFIIKLFQTYQDEHFVYMLLELVQGGELFSVMHPNAEFCCLPEAQVKFYALAIADALAYMHRGKYVFRDLKPENVMIDRFGYPVVIDFGFAKYVPEKTYTLCGSKFCYCFCSCSCIASEILVIVESLSNPYLPPSLPKAPAYLPPEVIMSRGHNWSADHWSLGVMLYEMITGESPFYYEGMDQMTLFRSIVEDDFELPWNASPAAAYVISNFLVKDPTQRLGSLVRGEREIFEQEWFNDMDLQALRGREIEAPWVPAIKDTLDTSCFDDWNHVEDKTKQRYRPICEADMELFKAF